MNPFEVVTQLAQVGDRAITFVKCSFVDSVGKANTSSALVGSRCGW